MRIIIAIACLGLLTWSAPASAQRSKTHELTVGHHRDIALRADQIDRIFVEASKILRKCKVTLKRKGAIRRFASSATPGVIETESHRDAVHSEDFDVKIVPDINFCRVKGEHAGCAWDPPQRRSIIVKLQPTARGSGRLWAHEFGHRTGLWHRDGETALMTPCALEPRHKEITDEECKCFRGGPRFCKDLPEPDPRAECPKKPEAGSSRPM